MVCTVLSCLVLRRVHIIIILGRTYCRLGGWAAAAAAVEADAGQRQTAVQAACNKSEPRLIQETFTSGGPSKP